MMHSFSDYKLKRTYINTENTSMAITWNKENFERSLFSKVLRPDIAETMSTTPIAYFAQHYGFTEVAFNNVPSLKENFMVVGYYEKLGKRIVSAVQHKFLPIVGV
jgi:hypothetical protein